MSDTVITGPWLPHAIIGTVCLKLARLCLHVPRNQKLLYIIYGISKDTFLNRFNRLAGAFVRTMMLVFECVCTVIIQNATVRIDQYVYTGFIVRM